MGNATASIFKVLASNGLICCYPLLQHKKLFFSTKMFIRLYFLSLCGRGVKVCLLSLNNLINEVNAEIHQNCPGT